MSQLTENFVRDMLAACERKEHPPLTVWESQQLLCAWQERERLRAFVAAWDAWLAGTLWPDADVSKILRADLHAARQALGALPY